MTDIDIEEGVDYFFQDDDENIDPDRDFSYIDKKIENVLGHYQKDFMGGLSAESLGARFGGYGSFLPMQQRSSSILCNQTARRKSPQNPPSECSYLNPVVAANHSPEPGPESIDYSRQELSESGMSSVNNQMKLQGAPECASANRLENPMIHFPQKKSLRFRVKVKTENVFSCNNSAIYSGLGRDTNLSSSLEDSLSDCDRISSGMEETKPESPSYITKIMTTFPMPEDELLSPLHDTFVNLTAKENNLGIAELGCAETLVADSIHGNTCLERKREESNDRNFKVKDLSKDRKSKQKEVSEKMKSKKHVQSLNPTKSAREIPGFLAYSAASSATGRQRSGVLGVGIVVSKGTTSGVDAHLGQSVSKDEVFKGVHTSICPKKDIVCRKRAGIGVKGSNDKEVGFVCVESAEENGEHVNTNVNVEDRYVGTLKPSKQKAHLATISHSQTLAGMPTRKECPSAVVKMKSKKSQGDGICTAQPPKESLMVGSAAAVKEVVGYDIPSKNKRDMTDVRRKLRKANNVASDVCPSKKGKDVISNEFVMEVPKRQAHAFTSKQKLKSSIKKKGIVSNIGSDMERDLPGCNYVTETVPFAQVPPVETVPLDNWVQCDKCEKWRLLPLGMETESLPKEWICSMLTWLPGKNRCSVSEEETNDTLRALYQPLVPTQLQNNQQAPDESVFVGGSVDTQHVDLSGQSAKSDAITSGGKRRNLVKTEICAARRSSFQEHILLKKNQKHSNDISNSRNQKRLPRESIDVRKSGDSKPTKNENKRVTDLGVSGVPKKMKSMHLQSMENLNLAGAFTVEARGEKHNNDPCDLQITQDFRKRSLKSPCMKVKDNTQVASATDSDIKNIFAKKRKLDQQNNVASTEHCGRVSSKVWIKGKNCGTEHREEKNEKKLKASNLQGREFSIDKSDGKCRSDGVKHNLGCSGDNGRHERGRMDRMPLAGHHANNASQKIVEVRKISGKAFDLGLSDNAAASSSSNIKACGVKCSPVGSISSSPFRFSMSDPDKGTHKMSTSCNVSEDIEASNSMKKGSSHWAANTALKEATYLKNSADDLKISGSTLQRTEIFFQAALKFLHGASLSEPSNHGSVRYGEMRSTEAYSTTASLCEYCAHEYERRNNLASAALAYKCMEVAYMRVVYCNDLCAIRDCMALQTAITAPPQVESPSSSASDIDNLNNQAAIDTVKDGHTALDHRVHVISVGNRPNFVRLLNFTENINRAMEASRRSQHAFASANPILSQAGNQKGISAVKSVLDFSFHDVDGLLHLVHLAMEALKN